MKTNLLAALADYRLLLLEGVIIFGVSVFLPQITLSSEAIQACQKTMLCTNGHTPWGAFTSLFLYDSWENVPAYLAIVLLFIVSSLQVESTERRNRSWFLLAGSFASAVIANFLWMALRPDTYSFGPSGIVYALWGMLFGFTLFDGFVKCLVAWIQKNWPKNKKELYYAIFNIFVFSIILGLLFLFPAGFLSVQNGVNVFAHGISFYSAFVITLVYYWLKEGSRKGDHLLALQTGTALLASVGVFQIGTHST